MHNIFGFQRLVADGGMAQYMRIPATARVHKIPRELPLEDAAIIEPLSCAIHAVNRGDIQLDDVVVIAGAGPIGLMMVQVATLKTPKTLVVIDPVAVRLDSLRNMAPIMVIDPTETDACSQARLTGGYGCDVYIEASGSPSRRYAGPAPHSQARRFVEFSVFGSETTVDWSIIGDRKELDIRGSHLGPYCYPIAIDLLSRGLVTSKGIVTNTYGLSDWNEALAVSARPEAVKVLLRPGFQKS